MRILVAGIGNIFQRDDGFGSAVAERLADGTVPDDVRVEDYGIRGLHLALELLEGYDLLVLVDAIACGEPPGTVVAMEPEVHADAEPLDAHRMDPHAVLGRVTEMGGSIGRVVVVGCQPLDLDDGIGLTPPVEAAVDTAVRMIEELITERNAPCPVA